MYSYDYDLQSVVANLVKSKCSLWRAMLNGLSKYSRLLNGTCVTLVITLMYCIKLYAHWPTHLVGHFAFLFNCIPAGPTSFRFCDGSDL